MTRFVADFLPLNGNNFFDMSGEMPPQLRVLINVPPEFEESYFKYNQNGGDYEKRSFFENQDKLKDILIERYRNLATQRLRGMRQGKNLGSIGVYKQQVELDMGVSMQYDSLWGREYVTLIFAEWLVRRILEKIGPAADQRMLVFYGTNQIAVVAISGKGKLSRVKTVTLETSRWEKPGPWSTWYPKYSPTLFLKTAQMKVSQNFHAIACPLKITNWVFSVADPIEKYCVYNVAETLNGCVESTVYVSKTNPSGAARVDPIINGEGDTLYNHYLDKFSRKLSSASGGGGTSWDGVIVLPGGGSLPDQQFNASHTPPSAISPTGERWGPVAYAWSGGAVNNGWVIAYTQAQKTIAIAFFESLPASSPPIMWCYGPGDSDFTGKYSGPATSIPFPGGGGGGSDTMSLTTNIMVYETSNGLDVHRLKPLKVTVRSYNLVYSVYGSEVTYGEIANTNDNSNVDDPIRQLTTMQFPYALSVAGRDMYYRIDHVAFDGSNPVYYYDYHTPYETWQSPRTSQSDGVFEPAVDQYFCGWLHLSDGKNLIQGYLKNGERRIYLNRVEIGQTLATVIGCSLDDIVTMFLGVRTSDIDKLK